MDSEVNLQSLVGRWIHVAPDDSDDYLVEYAISIRRGKPVVKAHDLHDGEKFIITDITWDGTVLRFKSLMPSTKREGINEFSLLPSGNVQSRFTFTYVEEMKRAPA